MKSTALVLLTAATLAVSVSGCSTTDPGRATTQSPATETTSPSNSKPASSGPELDLSKFTSDPCQLLKADQLAQLGTFKAPLQRDAPLGPSCRWAAQETTKGAAYSVTLSTKGNSLQSMIENARREPVFRESTVAEYPAFSSDGTNGKGDCSTYVGTSSKDAIVVQMNTQNKESPEYKDSCGATEKVAALVVQNLKG